MGYNRLMQNTPTPDKVTVSPKPKPSLSTPDAVNRVVRGELSMTAAAKLAGVSVSGLRLKVLKHPDYERAKAAGNIQAKPVMAPRDVGELRKHPAVIDVVDNGMTYAAAGEKHGEYAATVHDWVHKAYPDFGQIRKVGVRPAGGIPDTAYKDPEFIRLRQSLQACAERLGVPAKDLGLALAKEV